MPPRIASGRDPSARTPLIPVVRRWLLVFTAAFVAFYGRVPAQVASINLSRDLVTLGIASANMLPNQPTVDARPLWEAAMNYATSRPAITSITTDPGVYYFHSTNSNTHAGINLAANRPSTCRAPNFVSATTGGSASSPTARRTPRFATSPSTTRRRRSPKSRSPPSIR